MVHIVRATVLMVLIFVTCSQAAEVGGIAFADSIQQDDGTHLVLNGAGIRHKWFIDIYAIGLYVPVRMTALGEMLASTAPKQIRMHFLYKEVSKEKLLKGMEEGFEDNLSAVELKEVEKEIAQLRSFLKTAYKGDEVVLDYTPGVGTRIKFNNKLQGIIPGLHFHQAILRVWLGEDPVDKKLKEHLLGQ